MLLTAKSVRMFTWLSAILLTLTVFTQLPLSTLPDAIARLSPAEWIMWITVNLLTIGLLVARWQVMTRALGLMLGFVPLLLVRQAGQLVSFITPGPQFGGEPMQVLWLWKNYHLSGHVALLAVGLDRFLELWINFAVLLFAVLLLLLTATNDTATWQIVAGLLTALVLLLSALGWALIGHPATISAGLQRLTRRWQNHAVLGKLDKQWNQISVNLLALTREHKWSLLVALVLSLLGWAGMVLELWLLLGFFAPSADVDGFIVLFVATRLAFLLPLPGGIGTLEAAVFWACQGLGLPATAALGIIVLMRLRDAVIMSCGMTALRYLNSRLPR